MKEMILAPLRELREYEELRERLKKETGILSLTGCIEAEKAHMIYGLSFDVPSVLVVVENEYAARNLIENLRFYVPEVLYYPAKDLLFYQADVASNALDRQRIAVMRKLVHHRGQAPVVQSAPEVPDPLGAVVVAPIAALMDHVTKRVVFEAEALDFEIGGAHDFEELKKVLVLLGYERCGLVEMQGQFSFRGDILDIWPMTEDHPVRIEFFGDEIDAMRLFDPESQRSVEELENISVYPAKDVTGDTEPFIKWFDRDETYMFLDEPHRLYDAAQLVEAELDESLHMRAEKGLFDEGKHFADDFRMPEIMGTNELLGYFEKCHAVALSMLDLRRDKWHIKETFMTNAQAAGTYNGSVEMLAQDLKKYRKRGFRVLIVSASHTRAKRLVEGLEDYEVPSHFTENDSAALEEGQVVVTYGHLTRGFEYPLIKFAFISETDIFGAREVRKKKRKTHSEHEQRIGDLHELKVGDYVVHENHGLGIYRGIEHIEIEGAMKDYIKLEYQGSNLYILATQLDMLMKYGGADGAKPKLNRIGGDTWKKTRARVKAAVKDIAKDLVDLYAVRQLENGFVYGPDTEWQKEFEELFPYDETEDQIRAIEDTKRDMESRHIMDRLICGDVGYGKTEIALRAAFKAVQENKQVAYLVPTTILAQQHFQTFSQRMKDFPVRVDLMCRFRSDAQQKKTVKDLKTGMVDIVIGTHRLLSKDIAFKDLGLLIIDEEQRFGVAHKEKIKQMRKNVDVLTLTATPIPRTLHMSLIGIRDMSVLTEPPEDRVPIQTYVMEYNSELVREAITRELARNGQVYYVYNRVNDIAEEARVIREMVPEAHVAYAHGQMKERELEQIMVDFINGEIDVLVTTTIIETGLDISNVNTMIIHDADRFGLSQLYQLRGRVGRSGRTAYAFLMYRRDKMLKEVAEKRLSAIKEFTELGSGIRIAMRDLEIRGAGNLLGAEQSGHMEAVGYDLYAKMLSDAVKEAKGEAAVPEENFETVVDLNIDAYIPDRYIPNEFQKLDAYKRIAGIADHSDYEDVLDELLDRYGEPPASVTNLMKIAELKSTAHRASIAEIKENPREVKLLVAPDPAFDVAKIPDLLLKHRGHFSIHPFANETFFLYHGDRGEKMLAELQTFAADLA